MPPAGCTRNSVWLELAGIEVPEKWRRTTNQCFVSTIEKERNERA
jgi:hypothetical protein